MNIFHSDTSKVHLICEHQGDLKYSEPVNNCRTISSTVNSRLFKRADYKTSLYSRILNLYFYVFLLFILLCNRLAKFKPYAVVLKNSLASCPYVLLSSQYLKIPLIPSHAKILSCFSLSKLPSHSNHSQ